MPDHNVTLTGNMHVKPIEYQPGWLLYHGYDNAPEEAIAAESEPNLGASADDWSNGVDYGENWICLWRMPEVQPTKRTYSPGGGKINYAGGKWYTSADGKRRWGEKFTEAGMGPIHCDIEGYYNSKAYRQNYDINSLF
jgi:hypothetical protein